MLQRTMQSMQKAIVISRIIVKSPQLLSIPPRTSKKRNCNSQDCMCTAPADMLDIHSASSAHQISIGHNPPRRRRNKKSNHHHAPPSSSAQDYSHRSNYPHCCSPRYPCHHHGWTCVPYRWQQGFPAQRRRGHDRPGTYHH